MVYWCSVPNRFQNLQFTPPKKEDKDTRPFVVGVLPGVEVDKVCGHIFFFLPIISPRVKESKTILDSEFRAVDSGFQGTGFRILCQWQLDSGLQSLPGFRVH